MFKLNLSVEKAKNVHASTGKTSRNVDAKMTFRSLCLKELKDSGEKSLDEKHPINKI